ncbi:MAG: ATP-binding protein [Phycisphaeraceae bacterium]|nr:ATP-binding protein [Phycisphaeraceae bacterium]
MTYTTREGTAPNASSGLITEYVNRAALSSPALLSERLPHLLMSVLERRYIGELAAAATSVDMPSLGSIPFLRPVIAIGRSQAARLEPHAARVAASAGTSAMLSACHERGNAFVNVLYGDGGKMTLAVGARRIPGAAGRATPDYLAAQAAALHASQPGLVLGAPALMDEEGWPELCEILNTGCIGVSLGVPGIVDPRGGLIGGPPGVLERLARSMGHHRFAVMVVAEPLDVALLDEAIDTCRHLRSEVHSYIRRTVSRSQSTGTSRQEVDRKSGDSSWQSQLPTHLYYLAAFCGVLTVVPGLQGLGALASAATTGAVAASMNSAARRSSGGSSVTTSDSDTAGMELLDANAQACESLLLHFEARLSEGRSTGWWRSCTYLVADTESSLQSLGSAFRAGMTMHAPAAEQIRLVRPAPHLIRRCVSQAAIANLHPAGDAQWRHPLGESFNSLGTCLASRELAVLVTPPATELPGLQVRDAAEFALTVPSEDADAIDIGHVCDHAGRDVGKLQITLQGLNRHVFVSGMTGYGKSNTCFRILTELWTKHRIPFLVIEPAKTEYRELRRSLGSDLRVFGFGGAGNEPLRLNPLGWVKGFRLSRHVDMLKAVFNASFPMFAGMPYVLEEALLEVYAERGWSIYDSGNAARQMIVKDRQDHLLRHESALVPCLTDLHDKIDAVLQRKAYGQEITKDMGAALRSRLRSLMLGSKGLVLDTRRSTPTEALFDRPAIIELEELGDPEEQAFVMALVLTMLYEHTQARQSGVRAGDVMLRHVTLVEEAHRLLSGERRSSELGDPRGKAVSVFTNMLAEIRAYGEGFIISDQIPTKLAPEIIKNSNLKIIHRLSAADDRTAVGACMNLSEQQLRHMNNLHRGQAIVHDDRIGEAVLATIVRVKDSPTSEVLPVQMPVVASSHQRRSHLRRGGACDHCTSPCDYSQAAPIAIGMERSDAMAARLVDAIIAGRLDLLASATASLRAAKGAVQASTDEHVANGMTYCAVSQALIPILSRLLTARTKLLGGMETRQPTDYLLLEHALASVAGVIEGVLRDRDVISLHDARLSVVGALRGASIAATPHDQESDDEVLMSPWVAPHASRIAKQVVSLLAPGVTGQEVFDRIAPTLLQGVDTAIFERWSDSTIARRVWLASALRWVPLPASVDTTRREWLASWHQADSSRGE